MSDLEKEKTTKKKSSGKRTKHQSGKPLFPLDEIYTMLKKKTKRGKIAPQVPLYLGSRVRVHHGGDTRKGRTIFILASLHLTVPQERDPKGLLFPHRNQYCDCQPTCLLRLQWGRTLI
ncbi:hypothetical protein CDAR_601191 [Caerostris darwini]|uniref:Ribosomal protein S12 n=1 Tax=Caerostris darwini TaxID=1538125 RepID=A0AAV4QFL6_9ARAC|nr:hypothetical protein CDAR_601191 [Caerostris darwini]